MWVNEEKYQAFNSLQPQGPRKKVKLGGKTPKILTCKLLLNVTEVILNLFKEFCINWFYKNFQIFSSGKEVCMSFLEFKTSML